MRITFLNQKGGVGKSTASILIGAALHAAGYRVAFDDKDEQGSITHWASDIGKLPLYNVRTECDVIVCDTPGRLDLREESSRGFLQPIIASSDCLIIVSEKSLFSVNATLPMVEFVRQHKRESARAAVLFNKVRSSTITGKQNEVDLAKKMGMPSLKHSLPLAAPFENIQTLGFAAVTGKHRELVLKLALEILK